jgi:hypothetical protein
MRSPRLNAAVGDLGTLDTIEARAEDSTEGVPDFSQVIHVGSVTVMVNFRKRANRRLPCIKSDSTS